MRDSQSARDQPRDHGAGDVVTGPVGSASLREPDDAADHAADLERLPAPDEMDEARNADDPQPG